MVSVIDCCSTFAADLPHEMKNVSLGESAGPEIAKKGEW